MIRVRRFALLAGLLAALPAAAQAQSYATDRGSLLLGGSAGFSSSGGSVDGESAGDRNTFLNFSPSVQYFVLPGLAVGGNIIAQRASGGDNSVNTLGVGPSVSYYFGQSERSVYPFVSGSVRYLRNSGEDVDNVSNVGYGASTGAVFMLNRNVGLRTELYYNTNRFEVRDIEVDSDQFGVSLGFTAFTF